MNLKFLILPIACGVSFVPYSSVNAAFRATNDTAMAARHSTYTTQVTPSTMAAAAAVATANTTSAELEACQMIYPTGEFQIARPTVGLRAGGEEQCVSVVKLVGYQMGPAGSNLVFATANLAAGDAFRCSIDSFPEAYMNLSAVESVEFPRDSQPTINDVIEVMNEEQKQNAGIKIAATAITFGLAGNLFGKNDLGKDNMLGFDDGKLAGTGIGMAGGAALAAASAYSGKVAGDVILSTGVNAAAGAIIGNATGAFGDGSALRVEKKCKIKQNDGKIEDKDDCLWGVIRTGGDVKIGGDGSDCKSAYWSPVNKSVLCCEEDDGKGCSSVAWRNIVLNVNVTYSTDVGSAGLTSVDGLTDRQKDQLATVCTYHREPESGNITDGGSGDVFCKIKSAKNIGNTIPVVLFDYKTEIGHKASEFDSSKFDITKLYFRDSFGNGYRDNTFYKESSTTVVRDYFVAANFTPITIDADDGGLVDFSNKARAKGTAIGGVAGGALGGISAYSGAQDEINERWVTAVREYKDSLQKFVCMTGNRFLSYYNDTVVIPYPQPIE